MDVFPNQLFYFQFNYLQFTRPMRQARHAIPMTIGIISAPSPIGGS